jgi:benzodiazapine receptor
MGYTAYRAWTTGATSINPETVALAKQGATLYTIQLVLNLIWTPLYFSFHQPIAATVDILALGGTVGYLAYIWGQVDPVCGWLLAPYLGWLSFATYLCVCSFAASPDDRHNTDSSIGGKRPLEQLGFQADSDEKELARSSYASQKGHCASNSIRTLNVNGFS